MTGAKDDELYGPPFWCEGCQAEARAPRITTTEAGHRLFEARLAQMRATGAHLHDPIYTIREAS